MFAGETKFLLGAMLLHLVAIPGAYALAPAWQPGAWTYSVSAKPYELDVDVDDALLPPEDSTQALPLAQRHQATHVQRRRQHDPTRPRAPIDPANPPVDPPPNDAGDILDANPDAPGTVNDEYTRPPSAGDIWGPPGVPGLGPGHEVWRDYAGAIPDTPSTALPAPTAAPERTYDRQAATKVLQDGIRAKDRKLGLDFPGRGVIRSAFVGAVYSSDAPYVSSANFSLSVDKGGKVTNVSLLGFSGGSAGTWKTVQNTAKGSLSGARLPMKSAFAKGAVIGVTVRSIVRTPTGGTKREGLKISFDPSDIGAKATRMVSAHVNPQPIK
jgi:hypothetical protein